MDIERKPEGSHMVEPQSAKCVQHVGAVVWGLGLGGISYLHGFAMYFIV